MSASDCTEEDGAFHREVVAVAVANYDFTARKVTELSFHKGDVIDIYLMTGNWWVGKLAIDEDDEGRKFPNNYVVIDPDDMHKDPAEIQSAFEARTQSELSVPAGASVIAIDYDPKKTWTTVEYNGRRGNVPTSFIRMPGASTPGEASTPTSVRERRTPSTSGTGLTVNRPPRGAPSPRDERPMKPPPSPPTEFDGRASPGAFRSLRHTGSTDAAPLVLPARNRSQSNAEKLKKEEGSSNSSPNSNKFMVKVPSLRVPPAEQSNTIGAPMTTSRRSSQGASTGEPDQQRGFSALNTYRRSNRYSMDPRLMEKPPELKLGNFDSLPRESPKIVIPESSRTMVNNRNKRLSAQHSQLAMMAEAAGIIPLAEKGQYEVYPFDEPDGPSNIIIKRGTIHVSGEGDHPDHDEEADIIIAATMPKIISYATAPARKYDISLEGREQIIKVLAACFKLHLAPAEFFIMLESRFLSARDSITDVQTGMGAAEIQINVLKIIREWVKCAFEFDFKNDTLLLTTVKTFLKSVSGAESKKVPNADGVMVADLQAIRPTVRRMSDQMLELFNLYESRSSVWENRALGVVDDTNNPFINSIAEHDCDVATAAAIIDLEPREYAEQLTLLEFYLFEKITPSELLSGAWTKKDAEERCPRITAITKFFNQKSKWAEQAILTCEDSKSMHNMLKFFLKISECLFEIGDYNGMMIYLSAVNSSSVSRLKKIWKPKEVKLATKLGKLMASNFKELRQLQSQIVPCVPYIGMTLTDLIYIQDGNPDHLKNEKGEETDLYNWEKIQLIGTAFQRIAHLQRTSFNFEPQPNIIRIIHSMRPTISEDDAYQLSLKIQPRGSSDKHDSKH